jgi:hypothetical protein
MSVENYDFDLGKFSSVNSIKPDTRALRFFQQVRKLIDDKQRLRALYNPSLKFTKFRQGSDEYNDYTEAEMELFRQDQDDVNDSKGDSWLALIIAQRQSMITQLKLQLHQEAETEASRERNEQSKKREACEWAMLRTAKTEAQREKERVLHIHRVNKANKITEEIRRKIWKQRKYEAGIEKALADAEKKK